MSTSSEAPSTIRQGGPGASHENAKAPLKVEKPPADSDHGSHSRVSGGGGEQDNMALSSRDKKLHSGARGLDSKGVQTDQFQDHAANSSVED